MSDDKDLTILLTLWDRVPCTFRWMRYASKVKLPFKVLIADGGSDNSVAEVLSDKSAYPDVDYEYIRYPYDATPTHYYAKVMDALNRIQTPYVVMADNDDFLFVDALSRSVEFLKNHADYSSCRGIIGGVRIKPDERYGELSNVYGEDVEFVRRVYADKSNLEETAVRRVHNYFSSYRANWYDVFRTPQTRESFRVLCELDTQDLILSQHTPMLLGVTAGKVQIEPYLYLLRQLEGPSSVDQTETKQKGDFFDRMLMETWSSDFAGFLNSAATAVAEKDGIPLEEARREIKQGYRTLMTPGIIRCLLESAPSRSALMTGRVNSYMGGTGSIIRKLYAPIRRIVRGRPEGVGYEFFPASQLTATDADFQMVYDFLSAPPQSIQDPPRARVKASLEYSSS